MNSIAGDQRDELEEEACGIQPSRDEDISKWSEEDISSWLADEGFSEEGPMFAGQKITGKALYGLEKGDLKEIGVTSMGRRLEMFAKITELLHGQGGKVGDKSVSGPAWKKKITKADRSTWSPSQKSQYLEKISILNREAAVIWPGNTKLYIKGNGSTRLKMEEYITRMEKTCTIPDIGFGREAMKSHLLQWFHEKNRKIQDGYDYEATHKPAKRAKEHLQQIVQIQNLHYEDSSDVNDMSAKSAEVVIVEFFNVQSIHFLTVRKHLLPLGKGLNVKTRSLGKYDLLLPLAKALFKNGHVSKKKEDNINYKNIKRNQIKVV
ncbi:unnamed protein product, partial [Porites lobata]